MANINVGDWLTTGVNAIAPGLGTAGSAIWSEWSIGSSKGNSKPTTTTGFTGWTPEELAQQEVLKAQVAAEQAKGPAGKNKDLRFQANTQDEMNAAIAARHGDTSEWDALKSQSSNSMAMLGGVPLSVGGVTSIFTEYPKTSIAAGLALLVGFNWKSIKNMFK